MTQHYVGTKIVEAWEQERDGDAGYAVKYADGYTSWSPKATFDEAYLPLGHIGSLPDYVQRMMAERAQVSARLAKLDAYTQRTDFESVDPLARGLLVLQASVMRTYYVVLTMRIEASIAPTQH